nr:hypothetical protein [Tanacetum cinerariifolium]
ERAETTFGAIWRPVLALDSWAEERHARLDLAEIVNSIRRGRSPEKMCRMYGIWMSTSVFVDPEISTQADEAPPTLLPDIFSPTLVPILRRTVRMVVRVPPAMSLGLYASIAEDEEIEESSDSDSVSKDAEDNGPTIEDEDPTARDEGHASRDEAPDAEDNGPTIEDEDPTARDEGHAARDEAPVGQSSRTVQESERPERVSALRQPILTTWIDLEDGIAYINVPTYPPPAPPVQTSSSPEWSSGSFPVSPAPFIAPSPISSPMIPLTVLSPIALLDRAEIEGFLTILGARVEMQEGLIHDYTVRLGELSPALFERYDRDIKELFTRSGAVRDEIFSQRYRFRSIEHDRRGLQ